MTHNDLKFESLTNLHHLFINGMAFNKLENKLQAY
jgi:hypothetical protein